jgi:acyl-CoA reductase-like NAD-dependent aldehyde dehydrogenase
MIVFDDADFDRAVKDAAEGGFYNKGEACTATGSIPPGSAPWSPMTPPPR